jgi:hypothetical protein
VTAQLGGSEASAMDRMKSWHIAITFWASRDGPRGRSKVIRYMVAFSAAGAAFLLIFESVLGTSSVPNSSSAIIEGMSIP